MKMTKRLVAVALAILMIFGSVSVAMTASAADGTTLGITTKFLRNVNGVWTETSKVEPGEDVKLGVYLDTDYYAGDGEILLFYDNAMFETSAGTGSQTLTVGSTYGAGSSYDIKGYYYIGSGSQAATYSQAMLNNGKIDSAFASSHDPLYIAYAFGESALVQKFDGNKLFCEIPLKVKANPSVTSGQAEAVEETTCSPEFKRGRINVSKGAEGTMPSNADNMWNWKAETDYEEEPVSLYANCTSVTFDPNGGKFEVAASKYVTSLYSEGEAGEGIANLIGKDSSDKNYFIEVFSNPIKDGYTFKGWKVEGADDSTATTVDVYPDSDTKYVAVWEKDENEGDGLKFRTEIYRLDENGEWVYTEKVMPGEEVRARLFIDTEYNAGNGEILLFYDGDFFDSSDFYAEDIEYDLALNPSVTSAPGAYNITGKLYKATYNNTTIKNLVENGYFDVKYLNEHPAFIATYEFPIGADCQVISDDEWFFEVKLKVKDSEKLADTVGDFYIKENTIANTTDGYWAYVNVTKETEGSSYAMDADSMFLWDADVTVKSHPVTIYNTIRFDANGGAFDAENTETFTIDGTVGAKVDYSTIPEVSKPGFSFKGWIDASDVTPTLEEAKTAEQLAADEETATMTHKSIIENSDPAAAIIYNAFWVSDVDVTFANINPETDSVEIIETISVTSGDPFVAPAEPSLEGYRFIGWTTDFKDGKIGDIKDLPENYPTESTTYYAVYSALQYPVNYYVLDADIENPTMDDFVLVTQTSTEYGTVIPAVPHNYAVPEGYAISVAYSEVLYGEEIMFIEAGKFVAGTTMPANEYNLYFKIERAEFDAVFNANGGAWADGETTKTVKAVFDEEIAVPEDPEYAGYVFAGWEPDVTIMDEEGKVFNATWTPDTFTATYHIDSESYPYDVDFGDEMQYPADPYKEGHNFLGWAEEEGSTAVVELPATMPAEDKDYYAVFEVLEYTITFENTAETTMDEITLPYGTEIGEIAEPAKTGYTFAGWDWTKAEDSSAVAAPATMPAYDTVATAKWDINEYTVTWIVDGVETVETYDYLAPVVEATEPVKTGYTFEGWTPEFPEDGLAMPAEDLTFTAVFNANTYDAVFNTVADGEAHDGRFDSDDSTSLAVPTVFGEEIVAPAEVPVRTGYTFVGWDPIVGTMDEEGKTYTAVWTPNTDTEYTVEFYSMNTTGAYELTDTQVLTGESDSAIKLVVSAPKNYTIAEPDSTYNDDITIAPDGSTVVTVYFERDLFTVTFVGNEGTVDGEAEVSSELRYGAQVAVPAVEREGYTFKGWLDKNGDPVDVNLTAIETVTYTADWEINQYTITFENTGDTVIAPITQDYGTAVEAPAAPEKLGHSFAGWDVAVPATMPAEDMTITAQWTVNSYDAIFNAGEGKFADDAKTKTVEDVEFGKDITAPAENPTREGYDFLGWSTDGETVLTPVGIMDAEGKEFKAVWEINQYTITFADTGDTVIEPITQDYATAVTAPADPVKEGYTFVDWDVEIPSTMPATDMTITAQWTVNSYDATFDAGEGAAFPSDGEQTETTPVNYDDAIVAPDEAPEKTGYDFAGWKDSEGNIIQPGETADKKMDADGEGFTAEWTPKSDTDYKVVVNYTDAATGVHADEFPYTGTTDNAIAIVDEIPDPAADKTEYVLMDDLAVKGYVLDEDADNQLTGVVAADGSTVLNLYYKATKVTATFDANDGAYYDTTTSKSVDIDYNSLVASVAPAGYDAPSREGYTFGGWQGLNDSTRLQANRTFQAIWTPNEYTINWDVNGDAAEGTAEETYEFNALINKKVADAREGYKFVEWVDENGVAITIPDNMPAKNLTIIAKYEVESFTINFNTDGGSAVDPITQDYGTAIKAPAEPTKEGYDFAGWSPELPATMPDLGDTGASTTVTAQWTKNNYTVTYFVKNPATGAFDEITTATVAYDDPISTVFAYTAPTGYSLVSVAYTDTGLTAPLAADAKMPANNVNLYFDVAANEYEAKFYLDDAKTDLYATVKADYNAVIDAPADPTKAGYVFTGWTPAVDTMNEEGKSFVAGWEADTFTATFKGNGGVWGEGEAIETSQVLDVVFDTALTAPAAPVRTGYTFKGWDKTVPATMPAEDLVFTAQWEIKTAKVVFMDGTTTVKTVSGNYGDAVEAPADPTKTGYTFTGWDKTVPATIPEADVTINATWAVNKYDVIWDVDGVKTIVKDVPYGEAIKKEAAPEKTGYTFTGWNGYTDGMTMPAEDVTFTAVFEAKTYTVTFDANGGAWDNGDTTKTVTGAYGSALQAPVAPARTGYTFQTWSPSVPTTMPAENATYKAIWATAGKVDYAVETYYMNTVGTYDDVTPVITGGTATIDAYVKIAVDEAPAGFKYDTAAANYIEGVVAGDGSTVFKVYYARNVYTIKFVGNEGTIDGNPDKSATYYYGTTVVEPTAVRTGYDFIGWSTTADGEVVAVEATALADATYYAQWEEATYTATFKALPGAFADGETTVTVEYAYGEAIEKAATPVREGYDFVEWAGYTDGMTMDAGDVTFTAVWTPKSYNAVFYTDNTMAVTHDTKTAKYTENYNVATDPAKTGYTFDGWYDAATNKPAGLPEAGGIVTMPLGGAEYYATWKVNDVNLVYRANGGTFEDGSANKTYPVPFGTAKADMPVPAEPTRVGYSFNGYSPALPETMPATQLNLVAQWTPNEYDVTFDAGEGAFTQGTEDTSDDTPTFTDKVIYEEQPVYVPDEAPVRPGYDFGGWKDEEGNVYNSGDEIPMTAGDIKLDAIWTAADSDYTVLHYYMDVNGTYEDAEIITEDVTDKTDTKVTVIPRNIDNFTFDAAASTIEGTVTADGALVLELYYVRDKNTFTTYDEDGNEVTSEEVYFDAPLNVADPTKEGYTFAGWTDAEGNPVTVPATMPGDKLDIYESWTIKTFDVTFDANTGAWADGDTVKTVDTAYGTAVKAPVDGEGNAYEPIKAGHKFIGWFDALENGNSVDSYTSMPELADGETLTFYARWEALKNNYTIEIYEMNPDGTMPTEPTSMVINNALVGETVTANVTVPAGFTLDEANSELEGVVPAEGELVLKVVLTRAPHTFTAIVDGVALVDGVEYYFDETVKAIDTPTKDGYTFAGWTETAPGGIIEEGAAADSSYPARMPNNDVTIYGVWSTNSYNAIFDAGKGMFENGTEDPADDKPVVTVPVVFGETITAPTEVPVQEGFEFGGWKAEDGTVYQPGEETDDKMTSAGATFEAVWNKSNFTVTFYGYEALTESPYKSANATKVLDSKNYDYDEAIEFPEAPSNIDAQYYTFLGWSKTEGGAVMSESDLYNQKMPAEDTAYYAVYERVKVMLIPNDDAAYWTDNDKTCTTVIDRTGEEYWYVYGLTDRMLVETTNTRKCLATYVDVSGDGYYEVVEFKAKEGSVGTGTVINVYDNVTKELVESFTIIIYGDLNGDGGITNTDATIAFAEADGTTTWSQTYAGEYCHYMDKASNINGDNSFSSVDAVQINYYVLGKVDIDQVAGCVTSPSSVVVAA